MNKTLKQIQKICEIALIISKIVHALCIAGIVMCSLSLINQLISINNIVINGVTIHSIIDIKNISIGDIYVRITIGLITCIGGFIKSKYSIDYYENELSVGTPLDVNLAEKLKRLGIREIVISLVVVILIMSAYGIFNYFYGDIKELSINNNPGIGLGIAYIILSLVCKLGIENKNN